VDGLLRSADDIDVTGGNDAHGRAFVQWWAKMTHQACHDDTARGIFPDQKYCDIVPALFDGVHIERDPGCNVASCYGAPGPT
jgi:hypothetical protein